MTLNRLVLIGLASLSIACASRLVHACALPTTIRIENGSAEPIRLLQVLSPSAGANQAPAAGVPPGEVVMTTLPSCIGVYGIRVTFTDGRVAQYADLNAQTIRGLLVR